MLAAGNSKNVFVSFFRGTFKMGEISFWFHPPKRASAQKHSWFFQKPWLVVGGPDLRPVTRQKIWLLMASLPMTSSPRVPGAHQNEISGFGVNPFLFFKRAPNKMSPPQKSPIPQLKSKKKADLADLLWARAALSCK